MPDHIANTDDPKAAGKKKRKSEDEKALRLAETTDVSPRQAKELMRKHGADSGKVEKEARNFKAEG